MPNVVNIGPVPGDQLSLIYDKVDALLLPTLLESYSGCYMEAFSRQIPVFTSDRGFARDVCEDAAFYFDPFDPYDIISVIAFAFSDQSNLIEKVGRGLDLYGKLPSWNEIATHIIEFSRF